jgi:hypothetical protein
MPTLQSPGPQAVLRRTPLAQAACSPHCRARTAQVGVQFTRGVGAAQGAAAQSVERAPLLWEQTVGRRIALGSGLRLRCGTSRSPASPTGSTAPFPPAPKPTPGPGPASEIPTPAPAQESMAAPTAQAAAAVMPAMLEAAGLVWTMHALVAD